MIRRMTFAAFSAAVVLGGAAAPAAANMILGGYLGPPVADAAGPNSEARKIRPVAPTSRHTKAAVATTRHTRNPNASARATQDARSAATEDIDPRAAYLQKRKGPTSHETWCDTNPQCNGWAQWLEDADSGKRPVLGATAR